MATLTYFKSDMEQPCSSKRTWCAFFGFPKKCEIWVLDYKPSAASINKEKTASQLFWYATRFFGEPKNWPIFGQAKNWEALSFRAKIPMGDIMCAFFDEQICHEFNPCKVKLAKNSSAGITVFNSQKHKAPAAFPSHDASKLQ